MDTYLEFASNNALLVAALVASFLLLLYSELRRTAQGITNVEPQDAVKLMNADALVLDLRSAESFAHGHIVNAKNITPDELGASVDKYAANSSKPVLAVCDAGVTSSRAVGALRKKGHDNVYGLKGGIAAWTQANMPLVTSKKTKKGKG
jgi:rhodanese-related sulfurtransferase